MILENSLTKEQPDGLFTQKREDYMQCLECQHQELERLLRLDGFKWTENLERKKKEASEVGVKLQSFLADYQSKLEAFMNGSMSMYTEPTEV